MDIIVKNVLRKVILFGLLFTGILMSCNKGDTFRVEGVLSSHNGDTLYLEHRDLGGIVKLDSVVLNKQGVFNFRHESPRNPEFYQLRIGDNAVAFAVDSTETLVVSADATDLYNTFVVEDSYTNKQLRYVDELTSNTSQQIEMLGKRHDANDIDDITYISELDSALLNYKSEISKLIIGNPSSAAAYYAVFQRIDGYLIFDPYIKQDFSMFGAVATSWDRYYPDTERTKHLHNFTMNALQSRRKEESQARMFENLTMNTEANLPDIILTNVNGERVPLSSLKGNVVLLDFVVYNAEFSPSHNILLNTLYSRYESQGFEIYQISFDSDEHFWKVSASNLPWITVRDPQSVNAALLSTYNVREIPTAFLIDREGDLISRIENYTQLPDELNKVM